MVADKQHLPSEMSATTEVIQPLSVMAHIFASHCHHQNKLYFWTITPTTKEIGILFPVHLMLHLETFICSKKLKCLPWSQVYITVL